MVLSAKSGHVFEAVQQRAAISERILQSYGQPFAGRLKLPAEDAFSVLSSSSDGVVSLSANDAGDAATVKLCSGVVMRDGTLPNASSLCRKSSRHKRKSCPH